MRLDVRLFGGFELRVNQRVVVLPTRQCRLLLAYLFTHGAQFHQRSLLAGLLWPDQTERRALRNLSDALWRTTQALRRADYHPSLWDKRRDSVGLAAPEHCWCDVQEFRDVVGRGQDPAAWARAVLLYRGEFMEGFYEDWCLQERDWLRDRYLQALASAARTKLSDGALNEALTLGQRWCAVAPWSEEAHRHLMVCYARLGRPGDCMAQYVRCTEVLAQEFGAEASDETKELYATLLRRRVEGSGGRASAPLVGRAAERSMLWWAMERAERGRGSIVLLHGEAGVGKTRLMEELGKMASFRGDRVIRVWSDRAERTPWSAAEQLLRGAVSGVGGARAKEALGREWQEVLQPFLRGGRQSTARPLVQVVVDALLAACGDKAHLLLWDDLHQADVDSIAFLLKLAEAIGSAPLLLVASLRTADAKQRHTVWQALEALTAVHTVQLSMLGPLGLEEAEELALLLEPCLGEKAQRIARASEGNPLLLTEFVRRGSGSSGIEPVLPACFCDLLASRLAGLSGAARVVLEVLGVLGGREAVETLGCVAGLTSYETLRAIEELLFQEVLIEERRGVRCAHQWVLDGVAASIPLQRKRGFARRAAQVFAARRARPERVAGLLVDAGLRKVAVPFLCAAGKAALEAGAPGAASELLTKGIRLGGSSEPRRKLSMIEARAVARHMLGDRRGQGADTRAMMTLARSVRDPQWVARALIARATFCMKSSRPREGRQLCARARRWAKKAGDSRAEAKALCLAAEFDLHFGMFRAAQRRFRQVLSIGSVGLGPEEMGAALEGLGETCLQRGDYTEARRFFRSSLAVARSHRIKELEASCLSALGAVDHALGRDWEALQRFRESARLWQSHGHRRREAIALTNVAVTLGKLGRQREGLDTVARARLLKQRLGDADSLAVTVLHEGTLLRNVGEIVQALRRFRRARRTFGRTSNQAWLAEAEGKLGAALLDSGRTREAHRSLSASLQLRRKLGERYTLPGVLSNLALCVARQGDAEKAVRFSREALRLVRGRRSAQGFGPLVLLNHYRILCLQEGHCGADATRVLKQACAAVREKARGIPDRESKRSYLRCNTEARAILQEHRAWKRQRRTVGVLAAKQGGEHGA